MADLQLSLSSVLQRLEAAVSRLEALPAAPKPDHVITTPEPEPSSLRASAARSLDAVPVPPSLHASVSEFDSLVIGASLQKVVDAARKIGGQVLDGTLLLKEAFSAERALILTISQCKKPETTDLQKLLKPLGDILTKASTLTNGKRTDAFNHLKVIAEGSAALTWVAFTGKECGMSFPATHVEESWQAAEFYNNKILVEYRNKDANHVDWAKSMKELYVPSLRDYTKKFHVTGPSWNPNGISFSDLQTSNNPRAAPSPVAARAPPPPPPRAPPPPTPTGLPSTSSTSGDSRQGMNAVFQEINKGERITSGLRKVTDDMKTKNRTDRVGTVPASSLKATHASDSAISATVKVGSPKFELQMERKWVIENQIGKKDLIIDKCDAWQSVYIYGCKDSVIQIHGKVNTIALDKCQKTGVVFKDVVAAFEVVNCTSVEVQCQGTAPSISVDNTTGCQIYLSKSSLNACITTAKSSEINVLIPGETEDADLVEHALAEQFISHYKDGSFITTPVSHSGG